MAHGSGPNWWPVFDAQLLVLPPMALFIALPALAAWRRRLQSREMNAVADALAEHTRRVQATGIDTPLDASLQERLDKLKLPDTVVLRLAQEYTHRSSLRAECAQRLVQRLRRRVAFERKMLARAASGLRRGAVAACTPPLAALLLRSVGIEIPMSAMAVLLLVEVLGCVMLWRLSRVEI